MGPAYNFAKYSRFIYAITNMKFRPWQSPELSPSLKNIPIK